MRKQALLAATLLLMRANAAAWEAPGELREAARAVQLPRLEAFDEAAAALRDSAAGRAVAGAARQVGRALEGLIPVPNLTVDPAARSVRQGLLKGALALDAFGPLRWDLAGHYRLGGEPVARLALGGDAWSLRAESAGDLGRASLESSWRRGPVSVSAGLLRASGRPQPRTHAEISWAVGSNLTASAGFAEGGRRRGALALRLSPRQSLDYSVSDGAAAAHALRWTLSW